MNQKQLTGILNNERCQLCGKQALEKCLVCLLENKTACYHKEHHLERMHKAVWIGVFE